MSRIVFLASLLFCSITLHAQNVFEQVRLYLNSADGIYQQGDTVKVTAHKYVEGNENVLMQVISYDRTLAKKEIVLSQAEEIIYSDIASKPVSIIVRVSPVDSLKVFPAVGVSEEDSQKFECYKIEINMPEGNPCRGYVAYPRGADPGSLPIYLFVHSAGVNRPANRASANFVLSRARQGYLCLDINAHGYPDDEPQEYYDALNEGELKDYASRPFTSVDDYYFHNMYLRDLRALDYAVTLPEWDGKRILVHGESQGGGQALCIAGIDERVTHCVAIVPAMTDMGGVRDIRKCGWPSKSNAVYSVTRKGREVMSYHDGATVISLFKGDLYMEAGNIDVTCDPAAVCAGYNNAKAVKSKQIYFFPWRAHSYTSTEDRVRDEWSKQVLPHRNAFFAAYLGK